MAVVDITTKASATDSGWSFHGYDGNWWGEKRCQMQGKFVAVAATSAALLTAMGQVEKHHGGLGTKSPEWSQGGDFKGHI